MRVPLPLDTPDAEQPELREAGSTVGEPDMSGMDACIRQREMGVEMRQVVDKADAGLGGLLRPLRCDEFKGSRKASGASGLGLPGPCGPLVEIPDADVDRDPHQVSFLSEQPVSEPHASHEPTGAELGGYRGPTLMDQKRRGVCSRRIRPETVWNNVRARQTVEAPERALLGVWRGIRGAQTGLERGQKAKTHVGKRPFPGRLAAGQRTLNPSTVVRSHPRELGVKNSCVGVAGDHSSS